MIKLILEQANKYAHSPHYGLIRSVSSEGGKTVFVSEWEAVIKVAGNEYTTSFDQVKLQWVQGWI